MVTGLKKNLINIYYAIIHSIAFVPTTISILFILLAFILIDVQDTLLAKELIEIFPWLKMRSADHATQILTTLLS